MYFEFLGTNDVVGSSHRLFTEIERVRTVMRHMPPNRVCKVPPGAKKTGQSTKDLHGQRTGFAGGPLGRQYQRYHQHLIVNRDLLVQSFQECQHMPALVEYCSECNICVNQCLADRILGLVLLTGKSYYNREKPYYNRKIVLCPVVRPYYVQ